MKEINFLTLLIRLKKIGFQFKYSTGKKIRNNLFNFIIFERRPFFFLNKGKYFSESYYVYVLCDCADFYFFNLKKKKTMENFL